MSPATMSRAIQLLNWTRKKKTRRASEQREADTTAFERDVERLLAPCLQVGHIVIMDNVSMHTGEKVRQAIEARGYQLLFLPPYSPDFSPIEEAFSKLKAFVRRVGARTPEAFQEAIGQALFTITTQDALGWLTHCGYHVVHPATSTERRNRA